MLPPVVALLGAEDARIDLEQSPSSFKRPFASLQRTTALPLTSSFSGGRKTIDFAANAKVTVDLSGRADVAALAKSGDYIVTWTEATAPSADVTFRLDAATAAKYTLKADATGRRLGRGGFMLIVR